MSICVHGQVGNCSPVTPPVLPAADAVSASLVPVFYAVAMAVSGDGSLAFGKLFDRAGIGNARLNIA
jgi:hypothetical protein